MMSNFGGNDFGLANLYKMNFQNTVELSKWALTYGEKTDYRNVVVEIIINENLTKTYILPDMFAVDYDESLGTSNGNGNFELILKQKRFSNRKIEIK